MKLIGRGSQARVHLPNYTFIYISSTGRGASAGRTCFSKSVPLPAPPASDHERKEGTSHGTL